MATRVGRHWQSRLFEAWLPNPQQRACISRSALQISWSRSGGDVTILAEGSNPLLVDAIPLHRGSSTSLKPGAEITFRYEMHVLLRLRFAVVENWLPQPPQRKAQFWTGSPLKPQDNMCTFLTLGALVSMRQLPAQTEALRVMSRGRDAAPSVFLKNPAKARQDGSKVPPGRRVQSQPLS
ncbi:APK2A [Symbiodinium necroappetens]|uniref:APK2A protein n=1 Tax=Symbiodinium necroappetens TaxID=1628268 RepID=A0A812PWY9_9DINO|nr:APK2A [Symbiodinium necroappetens]